MSIRTLQAATDRAGHIIQRLLEEARRELAITTCSTRHVS